MQIHGTLVSCHFALKMRKNCLGEFSSLRPALPVGFREFQDRLFRGISWVYEITKYIRYKKTMADGEEDEYEARIRKTIDPTI